MNKVQIIVVLLGIAVSGPALSQTPSPANQKSLLALKVLATQLRDYAQAHIIPKMKEMKATLDGAMLPEDLQNLNKLRDQAAQMKEEGRKDALLLKKARQSNNTSDAEVLKGKMKELLAGRKDLLANLKSLGLKYKTNLEELGKEVKPSSTVWVNDVKILVAVWYMKYQGDISADHKKAFTNGLEKLKTFGAIDAGTKAKLAAAWFMLWDGADLPDVAQFFDDASLSSDKTADAAPDGYLLQSNYPNPFNPTTTISFSIPQAQHVSLIVYDALGREVAKLVDAELGSGNHTVTFDGQNLASGVYIYRIRAGDFVQEKKMQLVK